MQVEIHLDELKKKIVIIYLVVICAGNAGLTAFFYYTDVRIAYYSILLFSVIHLVWLIQICKAKFRDMEPFIPYYFSFLTLFLCPMTIISWKAHIPITFVWYIFIPFGVALFLKNASIIKWCIYVTSAIIFCVIISDFVPYNAVLNEGEKLFFNIFNTIYCFSFMSIYYYSNAQINAAEKLAVINNQNDLQKSISEENHTASADSEENKNKLDALFERIKNYIENSEAYKKPDFTISKLAMELNSNVNYISKAIKRNKGTNFNTFVNEYRIELVKRLLQEGFLDKFSMDTLYSKAGFKYQSTFNEVFRKFTGKTPTEYITRS